MNVVDILLDFMEFQFPKTALNRLYTHHRIIIHRSNFWYSVFYLLDVFTHRIYGVDFVY